MTEQEAKDRCAQLAAEHPDRATSNWLPVKQKDGTWAVARIPLPPPVNPTGEETKSEPRPMPGNANDDLLGGNLPGGWYAA